LSGKHRFLRKCIVPLIAATLVLGLVQVAGASYNYDGKKWNTCPTETLFKTVSIPNGTLKIYSCNNNGYFAHVTAKQGPALRRTPARDGAEPPGARTRPVTERRGGVQARRVRSPDFYKIVMPGSYQKNQLKF
jgi:hypothetical protein